MNQKILSINKWCELAREGIEIPMRIILHGHSMEPFIRYMKDYVTIIPVKEKIICGDIVLYQRSDGQYIVHRVYRVGEGEIQTLGDGCVYPDDWIRSISVMGQIIMVERNGKKYHANTTMSRGIGQVWMAVLPIRRGYHAIRRRVVNIMRRGR